MNCVNECLFENFLKYMYGLFEFYYVVFIGKEDLFCKMLLDDLRIIFCVDIYGRIVLYIVVFYDKYISFKLLCKYCFKDKEILDWLDSFGYIVLYYVV